MHYVPCSIVITLFLGFTAAPAWAQPDTQPRAASSPILMSAERALARVLADRPARSNLQKDSVGNGIAIGAAIGGVTAFTLISVMYARCDGCEAPAFSELGVPVTLFGAGVGALVGYLIDRAR